jgi:hypothetical protein
LAAPLCIRCAGLYLSNNAAAVRRNHLGRPQCDRRAGLRRLPRPWHPRRGPRLDLRALTVAVARTAQLARMIHRLNLRSATRASVSASAYCRASSTGALRVSSAASFGAEVLSCSACSTGDNASSPGLRLPMIPAASDLIVIPRSRHVRGLSAQGEADHPLPPCRSWGTSWRRQPADAKPPCPSR